MVALRTIGHETVMPEDPTLERLYDYTKFHIGIYITAAGAMLALAGSESAQKLLGNFIRCPGLLWVAFGFMVAAGAAGGIIASTCACSKTFEKVWNEPIGPTFWPESLGVEGRHWATIEHTCFWLSLLALTLSVIIPCEKSQTNKGDTVLEVKLSDTSVKMARTNDKWPIARGQPRSTGPHLT